MLAEIFMLRVETSARLVREPLPTSTSQFVPFHQSEPLESMKGNDTQTVTPGLPPNDRLRTESRVVI
jgi:hypothetical protein